MTCTPTVPPATVGGTRERNHSDQTMKHTDRTYTSFAELFDEHGCRTIQGYAREAYDRTDCGVWTMLVPKDDDGLVHPDDANDMTVEQLDATFAGIKHGTIVEGLDAEFDADPLLFPFTDEELANAWQYLENETSELWEK